MKNFFLSLYLIMVSIISSSLISMDLPEQAKEAVRKADLKNLQRIYDSGFDLNHEYGYRCMCGRHIIASSTLLSFACGNLKNAQSLSILEWLMQHKATGNNTIESIVYNINDSECDIAIVLQALELAKRDLKTDLNYFKAFSQLLYFNQCNSKARLTAAAYLLSYSKDIQTIDENMAKDLISPMNHEILKIFIQKFPLSIQLIKANNACNKTKSLLTFYATLNQIHSDTSNYLNLLPHEVHKLLLPYTISTWSYSSFATRAKCTII